MKRHHRANDWGRVTKRAPTSAAKRYHLPKGENGQSGKGCHRICFEAYVVLVVELWCFLANQPTFISPLKKAQFHCPPSMTQDSETAAYCLVPAVNQPCSQEMEPNACLKKRGLGNPARWALGRVTAVYHTHLKGQLSFCIPLFTRLSN